MFHSLCEFLPRNVTLCDLSYLVHPFLWRNCKIFLVLLFLNFILFILSNLQRIFYEESDITSAIVNKNCSPLSVKQDHTANAGKVLKSVFVPNIGWASQLTSGEVWVQFNDGSQLVVQAGVSCIIYTSPEGRTTRYWTLTQHLYNKYNKWHTALPLFDSAMSKSDIVILIIFRCKRWFCFSVFEEW